MQVSRFWPHTPTKTVWGVPGPWDTDTRIRTLRCSSAISNRVPLQYQTGFLCNIMIEQNVVLVMSIWKSWTYLQESACQIDCLSINTQSDFLWETRSIYFPITLPMNTYYLNLSWNCEINTWINRKCYWSVFSWTWWWPHDVTETVQYMKKLCTEDHFCCSFRMSIKLIFFLALIVLWNSAVQDGLAESADEGKVIGNRQR